MDGATLTPSACHLFTDLFTLEIPQITRARATRTPRRSQETSPTGSNTRSRTDHDGLLASRGLLDGAPIARSGRQ
jgi:hypothetical protein